MKANADEIKKLNQCLKKGENATNEEAHELWDRELHNTIAQATKNQILVSVYESLNAIRDQVGWGAIGQAVFAPENLAVYHKQHKAIKEAIESRTPDLSEALMQNHLLG
jgi:DNA-binding FadR family transcriptional regulator